MVEWGRPLFLPAPCPPVEFSHGISVRPVKNSTGSWKKSQTHLRDPVEFFHGIPWNSPGSRDPVNIFPRDPVKKFHGIP